METNIKYAIINFFIENPYKEFEVQEIYFGIQKHIKLTDYQKENHPKFGQKNFHHEVRAWLNELKKEGFLKHPNHNRWKHIPEG